MVNVLFRGGPKDGELQSYPQKPPYLLLFPKPQEMFFHTVDKEPYATVEFEVIEYRHDGWFDGAMLYVHADSHV